jgi:hypothetical protein
MVAVMRALKFRSQPEPTSEAEVAELEALIGDTLPDPFREFLVATNGGLLEEANSFFRLKDNDAKLVFGEGFIVETFFPVKDANYPDRELANIVATYSRRVPAETLPIADNAYGDLILLTIWGRREGSVYAWDHEAEGLVKGVAGYRNVYRLTNTFSNFLDALTEPPPLE